MTVTSTRVSLREPQAPTPEELKQLLAELQKVRVAVVGDFCLDVYWFIDTDASELSLETGLPTLPVQSQRHSLGGAGNVVSNLAALGCGQIYACGAIGDDPWGKELVRLLEAQQVDTSCLLLQERDWATQAYLKPHVEDEERNRLDFGNFNRLSDASADQLVAGLEVLLSKVDVVIINDQVTQGLHTERLRANLRGLIAIEKRPPFIVDSRQHSEDFTGCALKINEYEAARLCGLPYGIDDAIPLGEIVHAAEALYKQFQEPVFISRGGAGAIVWDSSGATQVPAIQVYGAVDTVGAGDSMLAGIALGLGAGCDPVTATLLGSYAATVTIQKLHQTGTASPEEIVDVGAAPDFIFRPELAAAPHDAQFIDGTEIEIVTALQVDSTVPSPRPGGERVRVRGLLPHSLRITHAIFDHDGTVSTLRQGWEEVMEPMMLEAVLGEHHATASEALRQRAVHRVRDYIDKSTGIQTLVQMHHLVAIVREFGCVPEDEIRTPEEYKASYNTALMRYVDARLAKFQRGELTVPDLEIKGAVAFLEALRARDVQVYLASGTDEADVKAEAQALGYAELFNGGIYGSVGDIKKEAKRIVLERILDGIGPDAAQSVATFGDGPVEMRETHRRGGLAIGIASNEIRRYGLELSKRQRLIQAGADLIVPDFSQGKALLEVLGLG